MSRRSKLILGSSVLFVGAFFLMSELDLFLRVLVAGMFSSIHLFLFFDAFFPELDKY